MTLVAEKVTLKALKLQVKEYINKWSRMNQFEKLAWAWQYINRYAIKSTSHNPSTKIYLFEDIFSSKNRDKVNGEAREGGLGQILR